MSVQKTEAEATVLAKITYILPAWFGFCTAADRNRLDSFLRRCIKQGFWSSSNTPSISAITEDVEDTLFNKITRCDCHILQSYLSNRSEVHYNLRERHYNKVLIPKTADLNERDFLVRNVYREIY